jgi:hypothetical protein
MSRLYCVLTSNLLTASVLSGSQLGWPWNEHIGGCIRCQAHVASLKATRRRLGEMRNETVAPPPGLDRTIALSLDLAPPAAVRGGAGARVAASAVTAGVLTVVWMWRRARSRSIGLEN